MATERLIIEVTYNEMEHDSPVYWDWNQLCDSGPDENVQVLGEYTSTVLKDENES